MDEQLMNLVYQGVGLDGSILFGYPSELRFILSLNS